MVVRLFQSALAEYWLAPLIMVDNRVPVGACVDPEKLIVPEMLVEKTNPNRSCPLVTDIEVFAPPRDPATNPVVRPLANQARPQTCW